jgi:hypothetical protein
MERHPLFVQTVPELFQASALSSATPSRSSSTNSFDNALHTFVIPEPEEVKITASDVKLRRERQTFMRLPISGAVLFTVHTYLTPLIELEKEEVTALCEIASVGSLPHILFHVFYC